MRYSPKVAKQYAIMSFLLAVIELFMAAILALDIASNACQHPTIINTYNQWIVNIICHPFLQLIVKPLYYEPVFTIWLIIVIPTASFILAIFSFLRSTYSKWKLLSISGIIIHFLILAGILIEIKYEILLLSS